MDPDFHSPRLDSAPFLQPIGGLHPLLHIVPSLSATFPHQVYVCLRIQLCVCMVALSLILQTSGMCAALN